MFSGWQDNASGRPSSPNAYDFKGLRFFAEQTGKKFIRGLARDTDTYSEVNPHLEGKSSDINDFAGAGIGSVHAMDGDPPFVTGEKAGNETEQQ